jgi:flagellin-like protein
MKAIIRKDEQAVSPVIATILMVAITVVLAAVLYVMVSGLIGNPGAGSKPTVSLTQYNKLTNGIDILVGGITPTANPSNFKVNLENVGTSTFGTAIAMPVTSGTNVTVTVGGVGFYITWQNPGGSGTVSQGDHFVVAHYGSLGGTYASGSTYAFLLIWNDGSTLTTSQWQV